MLTMRWATLIIFLFIITVLNIEWLTLMKDNNLTNTIKINVKVLDVAKLRFDSYLRDFNKTYNYEEYKRRFKNFKVSLKNIARLNRLENNTVFGLTKFSDMSKQEFADRMLLRPFTTVTECRNRTLDCRKASQANYQPFTNKTYGGNIPRSCDWRKKGVVKPVLNQKLCNGCWAFSIVGVLESMAAIQLKDYKSRSIQELLDCSLDTNGCNYGSVVSAMNFICKKKLQFVTEEEYPMTLSIDKVCKLKAGSYSGIWIKWFEHICRMDEDLMVKSIATHGPLVVAVDARNWQNYVGTNVIRRACTRGIGTHVVQIVGYEGYGGPDEKTPIPYYIVRNSAGVDFGDQGYVKIAMKYGDVSNVCGIADQVTSMDFLPVGADCA